MSLLKKGVLTTFGTGANAAINFAVGILLARWLSPDGLGQYALVISAATLTASLVSSGLGPACIYYLNNLKKDPREVATMSLKASLLIALGIAPLLGGALGIRSYFGDLTNWAVCAAVVYGAAVLTVRNLAPMLLAALDVRRHVVVSIVPSLGLLGLIGAGIGLDLFTLETAWMLAASSQLAGLAVLIWFLRNHIDLRLPLRWATARPMFAYGFKLNVAAFANLLGVEMGLFLVKQFTQNFAEVGYYRTGIRVGSILLMVAYAVGPLLYSKWASAEQKGRILQVERVSRVFWLLVLVAVTALALIAPFLIPFAYGEEFLPAVRILQILLVGVGARFLLVPVFQMFQGGGSPSLVILVQAVNLTVMASLMFLLAPQYGGLGAAIAFAVSNTVSLGVGYILGASAYGIRITQCLIITRNDLQYIRSALAAE